MSAYRFLWWSIAVPIGSVGVTAAVVSSSIPTTVIIFAIMALCLGVLSANLQSLNSEGQPGGSISASTVSEHGCAAGFVVVAFYGLSSLIGVAVLPLAILLAVTCPPVATRWRARVAPQSSVESSSDPLPTPTPTTDHAPVRAMTDAELCMAWRHSFVELQRTDVVEAITAIAAFRQQLLDELERRNPDGFGVWLASGARAPSDPARYLLGRPEGKHTQL
jgi:hypothetical protein